MEEAKTINRSLSALGMVINALTDGKSTHVPYRDSKLTRILQESLGGNSRTTLVVNCSPSSYNDAETVSTLRFGTRAKNIKNSAHINVELSSAELKTIVHSSKLESNSLKAHIQKLEAEILLWRSGVVPTPDQLTSQLKCEVSPSPVNSQNFSSSSEKIGEGLSIGQLAIGSVITTDERNEFLKRENELVDLLAERESVIDEITKNLQFAAEELQILKEREASHIIVSHLIIACHFTI